MIGLVVDNPKRDLDGLALLAYQLACAGLPSALVPLYQQGVELPLLGVRAAVVNYARLNNRGLLEGYRTRGIAVYVLDTEGGVLSDAGRYTPENWASWLRESGLNALVDEYFCWGSAVASAFRELSGIAPERIHVTGCPRYDYCEPPWRDTLHFHLSDHVLVNANFSAINPSFTHGEDAERRAFRAAGFDDAYVDPLLAELHTAFEGFLQAIEQLADALPRQQILIRPHPFEDARVYTERFGERANVVVDGRGNVLNAIASARCVVHLNCGTAVESVLLGKMPVCIDYLNTERLIANTPLPRRISARPQSVDALIETVARGDEAREYPFAELRSRYIEPWFHTADGLAAQRVVSLLQSRTAHLPPVRSYSLSLNGGYSRPTAGQRLQGWAANLLGPAVAARLRAWREPSRRAKAFTAEQVDGVLRALDRVSGTSRGVAARTARHPLSGRPMSSVLVEPAAQ
jgi:surface carbohydrate biosynthesis protein